MVLHATTLSVFLPIMSSVIVRMRPLATVLPVAVSTHLYPGGDGLLSADTSILDPGEYKPSREVTDNDLGPSTKIKKTFNCKCESSIVFGLYIKIVM